MPVKKLLTFQIWICFISALFVVFFVEPGTPTPFRPTSRRGGVFHSKIRFTLPITPLKTMYDGVHRVPGLRREPAVSVEDLTHISVSNWKVDSDPLVRNLCELRKVWTRTDFSREGRSLLFRGIHRYAWGPPRRLRVPYVIPRPGVPRHMAMLHS